MVFKKIFLAALWRKDYSGARAEEVGPGGTRML